METSLPLASDSFSYSWLSNSNNLSLDYLDDDPHRVSITSFYEDSTSNNGQSFNFDTCISQSNLVLVHADEIFSNGFLMPFFVDPYTQESIQNTKIGASFSSSNFSSRNVKTHHGFLIRLRKSTWRTLVQFFRYVNQLRQKVERSRKSIKVRVDDMDEIDWQVKSLRSSSQIASSIGDFHDNSIYEAVLHCKKSIGK
ncbi:probable membrane-associated kinase regulator 6 [Vicia villosa]|uniref:probable membrane-associated kinase regulator 6 n=1 Tax=Vicia villosa TaxID=3911 RepID=UPI00273A87F1|nr:probable membrane-associated kinase regulator 6 [Vicia villosa]